MSKKITISLDEDEAIILFEALYTLNNDENITEALMLQSLYDLESELEKTLPVLSSNYQERLRRAKNNIISKRDNSRE